MKKVGIYKIINKINSRYYVGSSKNINYGCTSRFNRHKKDLINNKHKNAPLQNAWNKYGIENFDFQIIEIVEDINNLRNVEQTYLDIAKTENAYNIHYKACTPLTVFYNDLERKKRSQPKNKNPSFDNLIYNFKNKYDGRNFTGLRFDFIKMLKSENKKSADCCISSLISKKKKSYFGWVLV